MFALFEIILECERKRERERECESERENEGESDTRERTQERGRRQDAVRQRKTWQKTFPESDKKFRSEAELRILFIVISAPENFGYEDASKV